MSKKVKTIIIGAVILVLLAGVIVLLQITKEDEPTQDELFSETQSEFVELLKGVTEDLEYLHIKNKDDEYTIERQVDNTWGIKEIMEFEQTYYIYTETVGSATNIVASKLIEENVAEMSKYGLLNPELVIEVKMKNKELVSFSIGDLSPDKQVRYGCITGEKTVYAFPVTAFTNFYYTRYDYLDRVVIPGFESDQPADIPIVNEMTVKRPDLEKPIVLTEFKDGELSENATMQANVYMSSPIRALISETPAQTYIFGNFGIMANGIVASSPTEEQLKEFGFDNPTSEFSIRYNDTSKVKVTTGKGIECQHEEGEDLTNHKHVIESYYVMREGSKQVYTVAAGDMKWLDFQPKDILSSVVVMPSIIDLKSFEITLEGKTNTIAFGKGNDPKEVGSYTATLNSKEIDAASAKSFLQLCQLTSAQDVNTREFEAVPSATIKYIYEDGKSDTVDIYILEDRSCVLALNGQKNYVGRAAYVDKLIKEYKNLEAGNPIDIDW